ncbi:MAG: hypothetical protein OXI53_02580 [Nitrospira sp.]|nr:hypothetical protein [Nitrospira sp.]MDE0487384.1 hypothetical protein [Nitrospira sp.]
MDTRLLLQGFRYLDTFFPSGGFAFSSGLEAAVQEGHVRTIKDLDQYVVDFFRWGLGTCEAVTLAQAYQASCKRDLDGVIQTDHALEAMKLCQETRAASRQMGRSLLHHAIPPQNNQGIIEEFSAAVYSGRSPGHLAVTFGVVFQAIGWDQPQTIAGFLYQAGVGFVSASYKLLPIGQREGQRLLESWVPVIEELSRTIDARMILMSWTPVQDIYSMRHSQLTSRLFRS